MRRVADRPRHLAEDFPSWEEPMKILYDGLHVTADGSRVYAEYITQRLLETALRGRGEKTPGSITR